MPIESKVVACDNGYSDALVLHPEHPANAQLNLLYTLKSMCHRRIQQTAGTEDALIPCGEGCTLSVYLKSLETINQPDHD